jgi:hypothetical protein
MVGGHLKNNCELCRAGYYGTLGPRSGPSFFREGRQGFRAECEGSLCNTEKQNLMPFPFKGKIAFLLSTSRFNKVGLCLF